MCCPITQDVTQFREEENAQGWLRFVLIGIVDLVRLQLSAIALHPGVMTIPACVAIPEVTTTVIESTLSELWFRAACYP